MSLPEKPSLPSIQFLLHQDPSDSPGKPRLSSTNLTLSGPKRTPVQRHQASRSLSSLPCELQNLSLQQPYPLDTPWAYNSILPPALPALPPVPHHNHPTHHDHLTALARRPPGASHGRSFSDHSLFTRPSHQTHRRAASANTADIYLKPYPIRPYTPTSSAGSSPPEQHLPLSPHQGLFDALNMQEKKPADTEEESLGRYCCTFCHKKFSRPSSLRIHTYSHTGEKPFVCTEENCGRKFSVQSNMRRHLRVHRLGKPTKPIS